MRAPHLVCQNACGVGKNTEKKKIEKNRKKEKKTRKRERARSGCLNTPTHLVGQEDHRYAPRPHLRQLQRASERAPRDVTSRSHSSIVRSGFQCSYIHSFRRFVWAGGGTVYHMSFGVKGRLDKHVAAVTSIIGDFSGKLVRDGLWTYVCMGLGKVENKVLYHVYVCMYVCMWIGAARLCGGTRRHEETNPFATKLDGHTYDTYK